MLNQSVKTYSTPSVWIHSEQIFTILCYSADLSLLPVEASEGEWEDLD